MELQSREVRIVLGRNQRYAAVASGEYRMLYVTPERFRKSEFVQSIKRRHIHLLAVDEAHCISEWGHDFRPDYTRLRQFRELIGQPTTIALTVGFPSSSCARRSWQLPRLLPDSVSTFRPRKEENGLTGRPPESCR